MVRHNTEKLSAKAFVHLVRIFCLYFRVESFDFAGPPVYGLQTSHEL